mgnify:CR=1 FL=1
MTSAHKSSVVLVLIASSLVLSTVIYNLRPPRVDVEASLDEIRAEARNMKTGELKSTIDDYTDAIELKKGEIHRMVIKIQGLPYYRNKSQKASILKSDLAQLRRQLEKLKVRHDIYYSNYSKLIVKNI